MRRHVHTILAALLCVCLLVSYTPLPASGAEASVGEPGPFVEGQASTTVHVLTVGLTIADKSRDVTASLADLQNDDEGLYVLKVVVSGADAADCEFAWSRSVKGEDGTWADDATFTGDARAEHALKADADAGLLETGKTYRYTVEVHDTVNDQRASASIEVTVSDEYLDRTLVHAATGVSVSGALLRSYADDDLGVETIDVASPVYSFLEQAAEGMRLESAWQVSLAARGESAPFTGSVEVSLPTEAADGTQVGVVVLGEDGKARLAQVSAKDGFATVEASSLGAFAVALPAPRTYTVTATAGEGGSVSPAGEKTYAEGATPVYTFLADEGYVLGEVTVDGNPVEVSGNIYAFEPLAASHELHATFEKVKPEPDVEHEVRARVVGGHGGVTFGEEAPTSEQAIQVKHGESTTVTFVPEEGYVIDRVTMSLAGGPAEPVEVVGDAFTISAVESDVVVEVSYRAGTTPPVPLYTVSANVTAGKGSVSPEYIEVAHGGTASITFTPEQGWRIGSVLLDGADATASVKDGALVLQNVVEDHTIEVAFEKIPRTFTIEASATAGGTITPSGACTVEEGGSARFVFAPEKGYRLADVLLDTTSVIDEVADGVLVLDDVRAGHTLRAVFEALPPEPAYVTVSVQAGAHGTVSAPGDTRVEKGKNFELSLIPDEGYVVDAVTVDGDMIDASRYADGVLTLENVQKDTLVSVTFRPGETPEEVFYTLEVSASAGGVISPSGTIEVKEGATASFFVSADYGYRLARLVLDGDAVEFTGGTFTLADVRADHTLRAEFERTGEDAEHPDFVTVHATAGTGGTLSPSGDVRVPYGASPSFTVLPEAGFVLDAVHVNGEKVTPASSSAVTLFDVKADATLDVSFVRTDAPTPEPIVHSITAKAGRGGSISPAGTTSVIEGGSVVYALIPSAGYHVDTLTVDGVAYPGYAEPSYRFADVTTSHTIEVTFAKDAEEEKPALVRVTSSAGAGGAVSPVGDTLLPRGASQTFYFLPDVDKRTSALVINGKRIAFSGSSYTLFDVAADTTLVVEFAEADPGTPEPPRYESHVLNISAGSGGTVSPTGEVSVIDGGSLLLTFVPDTGYEVDEVRVGDKVVQRGGTTYRVRDVRADANMDVTFKRAIETSEPLVTLDVRVEAHAEGGTGGLISPSGTLALAPGTSQTFHVFPEAGYDLDRVTVNGEDVQAEALAPAPRAMLRAARAALGAAGGYRFTVADVTDDTNITVAFKKLEEDAPAPAPVATHEVYASATSGGMISPSGSTWVAEGSSLTFAVKADAGWKLSALVVDGADKTSSVVGGTFVLDEVAADTSVRAVFEPKETDPVPAPYAVVHASATPGGTVSPAGDVCLPTGASQTFAFVPDEGYVLDRVEVDGREVIAIDGTYTLFDVEGECDIRATFRAQTPGDPDPVIPEVRTVNVSATQGGTVSPLGVTKVALGSSLAVSMLPDEGYELASVVLDGADVTDQVSDGVLRLANITENHELAVAFKLSGVVPPAPVHTVWAQASAGGSIDPVGTFTVEDGESVQFTLTADEGYELESLTVNGREATSEVSGGVFTLADVHTDAVVYASFAKIDKPAPPVVLYTLTSRVEGGHGRVFPTGTFSVAKGTSQTFTFCADAGYTVGALYLDGVKLPLAPSSYTLRDIHADHELVVSFKPAPVASIPPANPLEAMRQAITKTGDAPFAPIALAIAGAAATLAVLARRKGFARNERR